jgi:hypothetical protein
MRKSLAMRIRPGLALAVSTLTLLLSAGCGPPATIPTPPPEPPPRPLGPEELGPLTPEVRRVETDAYIADVDAPPTATVKQTVQARVTVKAKDGLLVSTTDDWKLEVKAPSDVDVATPVLSKAAALMQRDSITYNVTVVPLRAGVRQVTFKLGGSVCDDNFCDVVGDQLSWNLEVK